MTPGQPDLFADDTQDPADEPDDPLVSAPMIHRTVSAASTPMPSIGANSVFQLAHITDTVKLLAQDSKAKRFARQAQGRPPLTLYRVSRDPGVTRCERVQPQETAEWKDREAQRRARQKPPKPVKAARTRSAKLLEMIGGSDED